ncbi:MAG: hypothetical protein ACE14L_11800 [Terriglobales bacterium]
MATIAWIVLGGLVASIAKLVAWDEAPIGWAPVMAAGIAGGIGGGLASNVIFASTDMLRLDLASLLLSIAGAAVLVYLYYLAIGRKQLMTARGVGQRRAA